LPFYISTIHVSDDFLASTCKVNCIQNRAISIDRWGSSIRKEGEIFKKILVPLDGSKLAECVLPYVEELANNCAAEEVVLASVTERIQGYRAIEDYSQPLEESLVPEAVGKKERQAQRYLDRLAKNFKDKGINVQTVVLLGHPAEEIAIYANNKGCDLIVIASHGRSGPSRWAHGSVTDKVFRASCVPILMVRAPGCIIGI